VKWATRPGCHIDRAACAWLIRRFIDPEAEFVFVEDPPPRLTVAMTFVVAGSILWTTPFTLSETQTLLNPIPKRSGTLWALMLSPPSVIGTCKRILLMAPVSGFTLTTYPPE